MLRSLPRSDSYGAHVDVQKTDRCQWRSATKIGWYSICGYEASLTKGQGWPQMWATRARSFFLVSSIRLQISLGLISPRNTQEMCQIERIKDTFNLHTFYFWGTASIKSGRLVLGRREAKAHWSELQAWETKDQRTVPRDWVVVCPAHVSGSRSDMSLLRVRVVAFQGERSVSKRNGSVSHTFH